ncbi:MAG: alpha-galactosidase [Solobacterium sp.]|nr:alpha-galactosidase [Solobacterium sp.]
MTCIKWKISYTDRNGRLEKSGEVHFDAGVFRLETDLPEAVLEKIEMTMPLNVDDDEKIFMNGYQTWTACPEYGVTDRIRGMQAMPKRAVEKFHLDRYGDYHFNEYPFKRGFLHGFSWCTFRKGRFYRFFGSLNERELGYTMFEYDHSTKVLTVRRDCGGLRVAGGRMALFELLITSGTEREVYDRWFAELNIKPRTEKEIAGYSSWYNTFQDINEKSIRDALFGCRSLFEKGDLFQIDDGWEPHIGDWMEPDGKKFPNGMKEMADLIHANGFRAGLWLAPFAAEKDSALFKNHPDWFIKKDGKPWACGSNWSGFYGLDIDIPEVQTYLEGVFHRVFDEWGFDLVKLDFLYAAATFGNERETRAGRMYRAVDLLRKWCGDHLILGCGVPVMPAFGQFEYCRISCDVSLDWNDKRYMQWAHRERVSTKQAVGNILSRRMLNSRAYICDSDVFFLREENLKLDALTKDTLARLDALLDGVWMISDDPSKYSSAQRQQYRDLRRLTAAVDVEYDPDRAIVSYELDGQRQELDVSCLTRKD